MEYLCFFVLYANIDDFDATKYRLADCALTVMDRWLLSRLNSTVKEWTTIWAITVYPEAARALQDFVDELSNWYVRRSRERYWGKDMTPDKISAYMTLYTALVTTAKNRRPHDPLHERGHLPQFGLFPGSLRPGERASLLLPHRGGILIDRSWRTIWTRCSASSLWAAPPAMKPR